MTSLAGRPPADPALPRDPAAPADGRGAGDRPRLVDGTELLGAQPGSGYVEPPQLVRRADGQIMQLTPLLYATLESVDGERDLDQIARLVSNTTGRAVGADDVAVLVEEKLRPLGLVLGRDGTHPPLAKASPLLALRAKFVVSKPEITRRVTAPFAVLFNPILVALATTAFAVVAFWVLFQKGLGSAAYDALTNPGLLLAVFVVTVVSAGFHEFGHAAALRRGGGTPGAMGAGLYLIYPAFYTDVTDAYRLGRLARVRTDLGGLYFNALVAIGMYALWFAVRWDGLLLVIGAQVLQMIRQLPPLIRFDGYHLLSDVTGVPDLYYRIGPTLRSFLPRRFRSANSRELKLWARVVVTVWTVVVVPLLVLTMLLAVIALPRILATTAHSVALQWAALVAYFHRGAWAGIGVKALAILALVVPVGGIIYLLLRMVRRWVRTAYRRTAGRPVQRTAAGLMLLALLTGLVYLWWPRTDVWRPIQPWERGTVQDVVASSPLHPLIPGDPRLVPGVERTTTTIWPNDTPLPTADHPVAAMVLVPRDPSNPTWVFPFDRPAPPGPGDNQSLAIVTKDGGTAYDVAFALVWADGGTALNTNAAYAFASCKKCTAEAISFQVVLVLGQTNVVAPTNVAEAISYNCLKCVTEALAVQLVVTLPDGLSAATTKQLEQLWAEIMTWSKNLSGLTFAQITAQLNDYERQILTILAPYVGTATTSTTTSDATSTATPAAVVTADANTASPAPTATTTASPTATTSPSPSLSPSPTATDTATATATATASPSPTG